MDSFIVFSVVVPLVLFVFCVATSLLLAQRRDAELNASLPDSLSYKWGFFLGYYGMLFCAIVVAAEAVMSIAGVYYDWYPVVAAWAVAFAIASYGVLMRRRWGWVFQIPLSLNMGLWAFNSIYLHNRWRELS